MLLKFASLAGICLLVSAHIGSAEDSSIQSKIHSRTKRGVPAVCPKGAASGPAETKILFRVPTPAKDEITISARDNDWDADDVRQLERSGFNASLPTLVFAHAYIQNPRAPWLLEARDRYDEMFQSDRRPLFNMLFYDWSTYSQTFYTNAAHWVPISGALLGRFLAKLSEVLNHDPAKVHVASFSLSTHVAGQAGRELARLGLKLGQITAIDPTGVCFHDGSQFGEQHKLSAEDAELVVARHYDWGEFGAHQLIAGLDIIVNGGQRQSKSHVAKRRSADDEDVGLNVGGMMSHWVATNSEAAKTRCNSVAYSCDSYTQFLAGNCGDCGANNSGCFYMDFMSSLQMQQEGTYQHAKYPRGTQMYLELGKDQKCLNMYQVVVRARPDISKAASNLLLSGLAYLDLGSGTKVASLNRQEGTTNVFTALIADEHMLRLPDEVKLVSKEPGYLHEVVHSIDTLEVRFLSHPLAEERAKESATYCAMPQGASADAALLRC